MALPAFRGKNAVFPLTDGAKPFFKNASR